MSASINRNTKNVALAVLVLALVSLAAWVWLPETLTQIEPAAIDASNTGKESQSSENAVSDHNPSIPASHAPDKPTSERGEVAVLEAEAADGSATAQRKLAIIYDTCFGYSLDPDTHFATIDALAAHSGSPKQAFESLKSRIDRRCYGANKSEPITIETIHQLMESAAQGGDLAAKVSVETHTLEPIKAERMEELISQVISARDPDAMLAMSSLTRKSLDGALDAPYSMLAGDPISEAAWAIAACQAGANCGPGSPVLDSICTGTGICGYTSYEIFLRQHMVPPGEASRLNEYIRMILNGI